MLTIEKNDAISSLHKPLWLARKKARISLEELEKRTGISAFHLDKIEFGQDEQRFLGMLSFANGCNCTLEFGCTKDLCHTRYTQVSTLKELGAFFRRLRNIKTNRTWEPKSDNCNDEKNRQVLCFGIDDKNGEN